MMSTPEQQPTSEQSVEYTSAAERSEQLERSEAKTPEKTQENTEAKAERARNDAEKAAEREKAPSAERKPKSSRRKASPNTKETQQAQFNKVMEDARAELTPQSRAFSRFIHARGIERTSEVIGATVARPNAILAGAVAAFVLTLIVYVVARIAGYQLSGFETIGAFIVGWVLGVVYDYVHTIVTGKNS